MATEAGGAAPAAEVTDKAEQEVKSQPKAQPKDKPAPAQPAGEKKLSGAELKKKAKEEKAARRAQAKTVPESQPGPSGQHAASADGKGAKGKTKQDALQAQGLQHARQTAKPVAAVVKEKKPGVPECFSHLSMARCIDLTQADKDVHPTVLALGQHMSTFALSDSITRLEATLYAFKKVNTLGFFLGGSC